MEDLHYTTALGLLRNIGPVRGREILDKLDDIKLLFNSSALELSKLTGFPEQLFQQANRDEALDQSKEIVAFHTSNEVQTLSFTDKEYPFRLNNCPDAPLQLYYKGKADLNDSRFVSIVGTRSATLYGKQICEDLIRSFVDQNVIVVSGLAYGIDAWAHHYCIELGVPTIAVLGHGLDRVYPARHRALAKSIANSGGLLTEFPPGTTPDRENFPKRNRIVAGMCDATIVIESKRKGGSLITAELANDYNRDVFAFPGTVYGETSAGCNQLIANNKAHLLHSPEDFFQQMGWREKSPPKKVQRKIFSNLNEIQQQIVQTIRDCYEIQVDLLSVKAGVPMSELNVELFSLEMEGVVRSLPGNKYIIVN